jgi:prepilin-type N-terminal cleavage/methylation domain-containing protein
MKTREKGHTLTELLVVIVIIGILATISWQTFHDILAKVRLNAAIMQLSQWFKHTRWQATDDDYLPDTLCITEDNQRVKIKPVYDRSDCSTGGIWHNLPPGVLISTANSTLRTSNKLSGNGGSIYRVSWADTDAGLGASWGQLGKIVLTAGRYTRCVVLFNINGDWEVRDGNKCLRQIKKASS